MPVVHNHKAKELVPVVVVVADIVGAHKLVVEEPVVDRIVLMVEELVVDRIVLMVEELVGMELDPVVDYMNPLMIVQRRMVVVMVAVEIIHLEVEIIHLDYFQMDYLEVGKDHVEEKLDQLECLA